MGKRYPNSKKVSKGKQKNKKKRNDTNRIIEKRKAISEKDPSDPAKTLCLSPSAGSQAMAKKLEKERLSLSSIIAKDIDTSSLPTNPRDQMAYLSAKYPGLRSHA